MKRGTVLPFFRRVLNRGLLEFEAKTIYANLARFVEHRVERSHVRRYTSVTLHFKITSDHGELSERKIGGADKAARTPARASTPSRLA